MSQPTLLREFRGVGYTARIVRYAPLMQMLRHAHDHHGFSAVLEGEVVEEAEHRSIVARAGWVVNKPMGVFHANRFGPAGATLLALSFSEPATVPVSGWFWRYEPVALRDALRLLAPTGDGDAMAYIMERTISAANAPRDRAWIRRIREVIDDDPLVAVTTLARDAGVHPVALARAFRQQHGVSVREYKQLIRIRRAVHLLSTTRFSIAQVALECGFTDHRHLCRVFRAQVGLRPGSLRHLP